MRALLLGTDLAYNSSGQIVPIEVNTNVGMDINLPEDPDQIFYLDTLRTFIIEHNFSGVTYIGALLALSDELSLLCEDLSITYTFILKINGLTIPYVEESDDLLIIRSAYDTTAIVDEEYCKHKINFMKLIKDQTFGSNFAYKNDFDVLVNHITTIKDNGNHPNFILKSDLPTYDSLVYPKLYKVADQDELDVVLQNVIPGYFLMEYHYNPDKLWENHVQVFRSLNLMFPPDLETIPIGRYTKITARCIDELSTFDPETYELINDNVDRKKYISTTGNITQPKLLDTDLVELSDGTFKTALDLQVNDQLKTVQLPNTSGSTDINYTCSYDEFVSGSTYITNTVLNKWRIDKMTDYVTITFTDDTTWSDTASSSYLVVRDDIVRFVYLESFNTGVTLNQLVVGDTIILIDTTDQNEVNSVLKVVSSIVITKQIFSGWEIDVDKTDLFLTKTTETGNVSYAALEHNAACTTPCAYKQCANKSLQCCWSLSCVISCSGCSTTLP